MAKSRRLFTQSSQKGHYLTALVILTLAGLGVSGLNPYERLTWLLEVFPVIVGLPLAIFYHKKYTLTSLLCTGLFLHGCVLMLGGAYTYARVPLGFELQTLLGLSRNPYDKIGHFFQGFVPALIAKEVLVRGNYVNGKKMQVFLIICVVLAISACYELIEWAVAVALGQGAQEFLGTQGYVWDTQSDMFLALIGAVISLITLSFAHDRQIRTLKAI